MSQKGTAPPRSLIAVSTDATEEEWVNDDDTAAAADIIVDDGPRKLNSAPEGEAKGGSASAVRWRPSYLRPFWPHSTWHMRNPASSCIARILLSPQSAAAPILLKPNPNYKSVTDVRTTGGGRTGRGLTDTRREGTADGGRTCSKTQ